MFNNKIKGYLSLISSVLIHLLIGNLFSFANLIPYYQSFLYYKHNNTEVISLMQLYFIAPIGIFVHNTFPSFMGIIDKKVGIRVLTFFATASLYFSQLILSFINFICSIWPSCQCNLFSNLKKLLEIFPS